MTLTKKRLTQGFLLVVPIIIGIAVYMVLMKTRQKPPHKETVDTSRKVRIIEVSEMNVVPRTVGYGSVKPARVWQAVAQSSGRVVYLNPLLKKGKRLTKDAVIIQIDPTEYNLSVAQARSTLQAKDVQLSQLQTREENNRQILVIETQKLELAQKELDRQKELVRKKMSTSSIYEKELRSFLAQKTAIQNILNTQKSIESEHQLLLIQKEQSEIQLKNVELQLSYTTIRVPFDGLIANVKVEEAQYVQRGQVMTVIDAIDLLEIEAQFANGVHLFAAAISKRGSSAGLALEKNLGQVLGLSAIVRPTARARRAEYKGTVLGFNATIDPQTRTPGIIVQVRRSTTQADQLKPFLIKGMYCEVEITGQQIERQIIIPRSAIHDGNQVYVADRDNRLQSKSVEVAFSQESFSVVRRGLKPGDRVIVTDIIPAIRGMSLTPVLDHELTQSLTAESIGDIR